MKAFVDRNRKRYGKAPINYPQPTEQQKQKMEQYDAHRETLYAAKGKRVAKEETRKQDALQQPTHTASNRRTNSSWMRAWSSSKNCASSSEWQPTSKSREVQIRVSHAKCKSE